MNDKPVLKEIFRKKKAELHYTAQDIVDKSGLPLSTVNNAFSSESKAPSVYTVGPICRALNISLDDYFGISESVDNDAEKEALKSELARRDEKEKVFKQTIVVLKRALAFVSVVCLVLLALIALIDLSNPATGAFRGEPSLGAVLAALAVLGVAGLIIWALVYLSLKIYKK